MTRLTDDQVCTVAQAAGFRGEPLVIALAVCWAESAGDPKAVNTTGNHPASRDRGLWQINDHYHPEVTDEQAFDPRGNADAAYRISGHGSSWSQWATFNHGSHVQFIPRAREAVARHGGPPAGPYALTRYLEQGDDGTDVRHVQRQVAVKDDGDFGPVTDKAVRNWQRRHGLAADGIVGPLTARSFGWSWRPATR